MKQTIIAIFLLLYTTSIFGEEPPSLLIQRHSPLNVSQPKINANFGEFRGWGDYKCHDGIDYQTGDQNGSTKEVFPIEEGTYSVHTTDDNSFGKYVDITHEQAVTFQTRYAHLTTISVKADDNSNISESFGLSGGTHGPKGKSTGPHLHFGLGIPDASYLNTVNPIWVGLKQPKYGDLKIFPSQYDKKTKIRILSAGKDETFVGSTSGTEIKISKPGESIRAVIQAYHMTNTFGTNPFKIEFTVKKINDISWHEINKIVTFETMRDVMANLNESYNFVKPCVTGSFNTPAYYFVEFTPTAGRYKITAKIYSCYRDEFGFHLSEPQVAEREIIVGLNGDRIGDLDWYDPTVAYAWLPDDISDKGIMLASIPTPVGAASVRASGATLPALPEVFYAYANNNIITSNLLDVDPNLQQKALIESRSTPEANWLVEIKNESGTAVVDRIAVAKQGWLRTEWGAGKPAGTYTFTVTATNAAGATIFKSNDKITIDNTKPSALVYTVSNSVTTAEQTISTKIRPYENLRSMLVNVVKDGDYSMVEERIYSTPFAEKDKEEAVDWDDAYAYPDGFYRLQYVMTDVAGNIAKAYSPVVSVNKGGSYTAPSTTIEVTEPALPELPKWEDRPKVSDIAFDPMGNKYVLYGRYDKLVKYSPAGDVLGKIEGLRNPLGLAVPPAGDRVYVADTYNNRVVVYDSDLHYQIAISDGVVTYLREWKISDYGLGFIYIGSHTNWYGPYIEGGFYKPTSIMFSPTGQVFITDSANHRVLRFEEFSYYIKPGELFKGNKYDATARIGDDNGFLVDGRTDYCYVYASAINDSFSGRSYTTWSPPSENHGNENGRFTSPESAAVDGAGSIYITDTGNNRIQKFAPDGSFAMKFGSEGSGPGQFKSPQGIAIDEDNHIWVADTGNHRIVQFDPVGTLIKEYKSDEYEINPRKIKVKDGKIKVKDGKIYIADAQLIPKNSGCAGAVSGA